MENQTEVKQKSWFGTASPQEIQESPVHWSLAKRIGFRFLFIYFVLFFLTGQEVWSIPFSASVIQPYIGVWKKIVVWVAQHILHLSHKINILYNNGDTTYEWILRLCYLFLAVLGALIWSLLDRHRPNYTRLHEWFRLLLRFSLALGMISYGISKVIPVQMRDPSIYTLMTRVGDMNRMYLLWTFMGASLTYEIFAGLAELIGGVLLLVPRTVLLGSLLCIADMAMVSMLDVSYNVSVKIFAFHYLFMGMILAGPDLGRLANLFLFNRRVEPAVSTLLSARKWLNWVPQVLLLVFGLYSVAAGFNENYRIYKQFHPPRPPLCGVWEVEEYTTDDQIRPPLMTDTSRWQRIFLDEYGGFTISMMSGPSQRYWVQVDMQDKKLTLGHYQTDADGNPVFDQFQQRKNPIPSAQLSFEEPKPDRMIVAGDLSGHKIHAELHLRDFALTNAGSWINP